MSPSETEKYRVHKQAAQDLQDYMHKLGADLGPLAIRVFALRGTGYPGSGFHWNLERALGKLITSANDFENPEYWADGKSRMVQMSLKIGHEMLVEQVDEAEEGLRLVAEIGYDAYTKVMADRRAAKSVA